MLLITRQKIFCFEWRGLQLLGSSCCYRRDQRKAYLLEAPKIHRRHSTLKLRVVTQQDPSTATAISDSAKVFPAGNRVRMLWPQTLFKYCQGAAIKVLRLLYISLFLIKDRKVV